MDADRFARVEVESGAALWAWLGANHGQAESVWLVTFKKSQGARYLSRDAVLDALVAHGWIDGRRMVLDDARTMQLIGPRKQQAWAESYKRRAARLIDEGRMAAPGLAALEAGKRSGLWSHSEDVDALVVPPDLEAALTGEAAVFFEAAAPSYRRNVLRWIKSAKRDDTRARRILVVADHAARGQKVPQY